MEQVTVEEEDDGRWHSGARFKRPLDACTQPENNFCGDAGHAHGGNGNTKSKQTCPPPICSLNGLTGCR
jgi:hypothetical protein